MMQSIFSAAKHGHFLLRALGASMLLGSCVAKADDMASSSLTFGAGVFVGCSNYGLSSSVDGTKWTLRLSRPGLPSPNPGRREEDGSLQCARFLNGRFVAVGTHGLLYTSDDGINWKQCDVPASNLDENRKRAIWDVAYGNGIYLAGGQMELFVSSDAASWTKLTNPAINYDLFTVRFGGGKFVVPGPRGHLAVCTNGSDWQDIALPEAVSIRKLAYGSNGWTALAFEGIYVVGGTIWNSPDGIEWRKSSVALPPAPDTWQSYTDVVTIDRTYYIPCAGGVLASADGIYFSVAGKSNQTTFNSVAFGNGVWVATGSRGNTNSAQPPFLNSADGVNWTTTPLIAAPLPLITRQPVSATVPIGSTISLIAELALDGSMTTLQWVRNGNAVSGANGPTLVLARVTSEQVGIYQLAATNANGTTYSQPAVVGVLPGEKTAGAVIAVEGVQNVIHPNGLIYDQHLLTGLAGTVRADPGQISRVSWLDPQGDIVQAEFSGAGAMTVVLSGASGPAMPELYSQNIAYMKGTATVILADADGTTHMGIFSVGKATAVIPTARLLALGYTEAQMNRAGLTTGVVPTSLVPTAMGGSGLETDTFLSRGQYSSLFREDVAYDGWGDLTAVGITLANPSSGTLGALTMGNVAFYGMDGATGVIAPDVKAMSVFSISDIDAFDKAIPYLWFAPTGNMTVNIRGGFLFQTNGKAVEVRGVRKVAATAGSTSSGAVVGPFNIFGRLMQDGVDVTGPLALSN